MTINVDELDRGVVNTLNVQVEVAYNNFAENSIQAKAHAKYLKELAEGKEPKYVEQGRWQVKNVTTGQWQPISVIKDLVSKV